MTDKIFGVGLGRTGTVSLARAMRVLGYTVKHNPSNIGAVKAYDFCNDIFISARYKFFDYVFPQAKFVLTVRDLESWIESSCRHAAKKGGTITDDGPDVSLDRAENRFLVYGIIHFDEKVFREVFLKFNEEIIKHFQGREHKLLVMDISSGEGWEKLCPFLGKSVPNCSFPYAHKSNK